MGARSLRGLALILALWAWAGLAAAAGTEANSKSNSGNAASTNRAVDKAFALPKGVVLRPDQQTAYSSLRAQKEQSLRGALEKVAATDDSKEKSAAVREVRKLTAEVHKDVLAICGLPPPSGGANQVAPAGHRSSGGGRACSGSGGHSGGHASSGGHGGGHAGRSFSGARH